MRRDLVLRIGQHDWVSVERRIPGRYEAILNHDIVTASAAQSADRPRIDDGAIGGRAEHEPEFLRPRRCESRLTVLVDDAHEDEPSADLAAAHQRPAPVHPVATIDDRSPS